MNLFSFKKFQAVAPIVALTVGGLAGTLTAGTDKDRMTITAGKLAREAKDYYGKTVTVKAEVENVYDSRSFTLDEDSVFAGPDVLVLVPAGMTATLAHDQVVTVTGRVRPYVTAELERDYDWFKNGRIVVSKPDVDFTTRPVLVAESLRLADGRELLGATATTHDAHAAHAAHAGMASHDHDKMKGHDKMAMKGHKDAISAGKLAKDSEKFYGQNVTVRAEVEDVLDTHSFTLDEDAVLAGHDVLVLVPAGFDTSNLRKDQVVVVSGKVRPYVATELERDFDWFKGGKVVTTSTKVDYETRPVLVADSIRTLDNRDLLTSR